MLNDATKFKGITFINSHGSHAVGPIIDAEHEQR